MVNTNAAVATVAERLKKSISPGTCAAADSNNNKSREYSVYPLRFLKKVGSRYGVNIVFTDPNKLGKICAAVQIKKANRCLSCKANCQQ